MRPANENRNMAGPFSGDAAQPRSRRKLGRSLDIGSQTTGDKDPDQEPAEIRLAGKQTHPGRTWIRMVIVVPSLAHADEAGEFDVVALRGGAIDDPGLVAL